MIFDQYLYIKNTNIFCIYLKIYMFPMYTEYIYKVFLSFYEFQKKYCSADTVFTQRSALVL